MGMPKEDCIYTYNVMPDEYGQRLRKGYREWATGVDGDVRSLIPYDDQGGDTAKDRLFAVSENGIYDVTLFNTTTPSQDVAFTTNGIDAGYGVHTQFTTDAGEKLILYADSKNGLHQYNGTTETWSVPSITFPDTTTVADIAFVMSHKQRIWLIADGGTNAYYLGIDAVAGPATLFNFGSKFPHGGRLMALYSWTIDGGDGVDDFLLGVSKAGDVLVYYGPDPSQPQWSLRGSYFIGELPDSRRVSTEHGGELFLLSSYGVTSVKELLSGVDYSDVKVGPSAKVSRFLRMEVADNINSHDWELETHPTEGFLQIITPQKNERYRQYTMNLLTRGWGWWLGVPALTAENWRADYYIGAPGGVVHIYDGTVDNTTLEGTLGLPIEFGGLTSFQPFGNHAQYMRAAIIRAIGVTQGVVTLNIDAVYDYNLEQVIGQPPPGTAYGTNVWDTGIWDTDLWDSGAEGSSVPIGASGIGRTMAVGFRGTAQSRITFVGWDVLYNTGGVL
jgi:hypothetical protein